MYEIIVSCVHLFNKVIIRLPIREHLAPIGYQMQPTISTFNPIPLHSRLYICTTLNVDFKIFKKLKYYYKS